MDIGVSLCFFCVRHSSSQDCRGHVVDRPQTLGYSVIKRDILDDRLRSEGPWIVDRCQPLTALGKRRCQSECHRRPVEDHSYWSRQSTLLAKELSLTGGSRPSLPVCESDEIFNIKLGKDSRF